MFNIWVPLQASVAMMVEVMATIREIETHSYTKEAEFKAYGVGEVPVKIKTVVGMCFLGDVYSAEAIAG